MEIIGISKLCDNCIPYIEWNFKKNDIIYVIIASINTNIRHLFKY